MSEARTFDPAGVAFGVLVPVAAAVTVLVTAGLWEARLPATLATHFSGGTADGFTATSLIDTATLAGMPIRSTASVLTLSETRSPGLSIR